MNEYIISEYIKKLTTDDIINYGKKKNFNIPLSDAIILLSYAKKYYKDFLNNNEKDIIKELKNKLSSNTYKEAYKLYIEYKLNSQK